ncbi:MAG: MFS transporter [Actinocatenispora sp.]
MWQGIRRLVPLAVLFALDGVVIASWAVRVPQVKTQVGASATALGVALLCSTLGALAVMPIAGRLCHRFGSHRVTVVGSVLLCLVVTLPALSGSVLGLALGLLLFGVGYGVNNVGLNSTAVDVETATGRTIMSTLHGLWSVGCLLGALIGGVAAEHLVPAPHLGLVAVGGLVVTAIVGPAVWRGPVDAPATAPSGDTVAPGPRAVPTAVIALGVVALCCAYGEGSMTDWAALHLTKDLHTGPGTAAYGFAVYSVAVALGRLVGDVVVTALGRTVVLVGGAVLAAAGMVVGALAGAVPLVFVGYVLFGLGIANAFPIAIARAGALGGPRGVATASTVGYAGQLGGPPLIGFLADQIGLPAALCTGAALAVVIAVLGTALRRTTAASAAPLTPAATPTGGDAR